MPHSQHARAPTGVLTTLPDGRRYRLRPPRAGDQARVADCFAGLSERSRRLRFFVAKQALSEQELDFFTLTDGEDHIAVAALALDRHGREDRLLGMARCLRLPAARHRAELALAVADEAQGSGLGQALIDQVMAAAAAQGIRELVLETALDNRAMQALAQRHGGRARPVEDGLLHYEVPVPSPIAERAEDWADDWIEHRANGTTIRPAQAPAAGSDRTEVWPWQASSRLLTHWYRDWIAVADSAFLLGRDLSDEVWAALRETLLDLGRPLPLSPAAADPRQTRGLVDQGPYQAATQAATGQT